MPAANLKGFAIWLPMMAEDSSHAAELEAKNFEGLPMAHMWDPEHQLGKLYTKVLKLRSTAWDVYFLYPPRVTWEEVDPPQPAFWMHQLRGDSGVHQDFRLNPVRLAQELLEMLGEGNDSSRVDNLGRLVHEKGIFTVARERSPYSQEDLQQAFDNSRGSA